MKIEHPEPGHERGWGSGWPNCQTDKMVPLSVKSGKKNVGFPAGCRREIHDLLDMLLRECDRRGYRFLDPGCWGFACRDIKRPDGTTTGTPSNHSWGLAVDINAPRNPNTSGPRITDMPKWMPKLFNDYGFRWGGDYRRLGGTNVDTMHYEFCGTPAECKAMTAKAEKNLGPKFSVKGKTFGKVGRALHRAKTLLGQGARKVVVKQK